VRRAILPAALAAALLVCTATATAAAAAKPVSVVRGHHYYATLFPNDRFTVHDPEQVTRRRVHFRKGVDYPLVGGRIRKACTAKTYSICDAFRELNLLDGFDLQPRATVPFTGTIKLASVNDKDFFVSTRKGKFVSGFRQLTFDPKTHTLAGISDKFLKESARYSLHVTSGIRDVNGRRVRACDAKRGCKANFTTRTASNELVEIRKRLDAVGAPKLSFTQNGANDVFRAAAVTPSLAGPLNGMVRNDQVKADPKAPGAFSSSAVPNLIAPGAAGYFAFGSFLSPRYQFATESRHEDRRVGGTDGAMLDQPTRERPFQTGIDRLGAVVVTPDPAQFPPPWPAAVYGPGFTRSHYDIFVSADYNAQRGILTIATDPAGHGYGPESTTTVTSNGVPTTFKSYGRGRDLDGDGKIGTGLDDGVGPTGHMQPNGTELPSHKPLDGLRSGLIQTTVDNMALGRALKKLDIPGVGTGLVDSKRIMYYGISFGGIYGTMLMGTDPLFNRGLLNVPGGPIADIARLSGFRGDLAAQLKRSRPNMLNGGPGLDGFTEDLPLRNEPPRVIKHGGAAALQELIAASNWFERSGSPETFAPRIRLRPDPAWAKTPKDVAFQTAYGDGTVPNPTAATLYRAGQLFDRVVYYRNDKTPTYASDPHGWLADPTLAGRSSGQQQLAEFLSSGQLTNTNPAWLEVPIADPNNLECLHYPDPQTGQEQTRAPYPQSGDCPPPPKR
jgi:hypothetical protein